MQGEKQAPWGSEAKTPEGTTSIPHCSRLPVLEGRYQMTWSWPNDSPGALECQPRICPTEAQVQPQLAKCWAQQGFPFPGPGHRVPSAPSRATNWRWFYQEAGQPTVA